MLSKPEGARLAKPSQADLRSVAVAPPACPATEEQMSTRAVGRSAVLVTADHEAVALVLGLSIHGLAIARALARNGIDVYAIEQSLQQPATSTRYARVLQADGINSDQAAAVLLQIRGQLPPDRPVVLYPSSDHMVRSIASNWPALSAHYRLSWADSVEVVQHLLNKANLEQIGRAHV